MIAPQLLCVPPDQVEQFWPFVEWLIRPAFEKTGLSDFKDHETALFRGGALLWIVWGDGVEAAVTTSLSIVGEDKFCTIVACGGHGVNNWLSLIEGIEKYAKAEGCKAVRLFGRKGWQRLLPGYRTTNIVMERSL